MHTDAFRNLVVTELDPNAEHLHDTIKPHVDAFLAERYEHYRILSLHPFFEDALRLLSSHSWRANPRNKTAKD